MGDTSPTGTGELNLCVCVCVCPQHYTKDADGLCTKLIKPKLMEGTVAAQDEFSRSKNAHKQLTHTNT